MTTPVPVVVKYGGAVGHAAPARAALVAARVDVGVHAVAVRRREVHRAQLARERAAGLGGRGSVRLNEVVGWIKKGVVAY